MPNEVVEPVAGGSEKPVVETPDKKPARLSPSEFIARRAKTFEKAQKASAKENESKPKSDPTPEDGKDKAEKSSDVLSKAKLDKQEEHQEPEIDGLSEEEKALLQKARSKLLVRVGELTAKYKTSEENFARFRASQEETQRTNRPEPVKDNPYASIKDEKELKAKADELNGIIEWAEAQLDNAVDLRGEDIVVEVEGKQYTKAQLREYKRNAVRARDTFLPDIRQRLADRKLAVQMRDGLTQQARRELDWLGNTDDERTKTVQSTLADPAFKRLEELDPALAARLAYIVPHAANSMYGRREIQLDEKLDQRKIETPHENPNGAAGGARLDSQARQLKDLDKRFRETGRRGDFETLRAAQYARKRNLSI